MQKNKESIKEEKPSSGKRIPLRWRFIVPVILLAIIGTTVAILQPPHPDAYRKSGLIDKLIYL
ncbi:MAG: hypothetical protein GY757_04545 [bacterium]|nr:hypothetical protein [bacterium]